MKVIMCVLDGGSNPTYLEMRKIWDLYRETREPRVSVYFVAVYSRWFAYIFGHCNRDALSTRRGISHSRGS